MAVAMDERRQPRANGSIKTSKALNGVNGHAAPITPGKRIRPKRRQRGFFAWSLNVIARLITWYSIFTLLFRCPASLEACNETSPKICKPYFHVKHALAPHVTPYYDAYAAPYIDLARPYFESLDHRVITPGRTYVVKYGGPRVAQAQALGRAQWERSVQPQILKYQALAKERYDQTASPYINKASTVIAPYYDVARTNALQTYYEIFVPTYTFVSPYAAQSYDAAYSLTKDTVIPSTVWAWNKTHVFLDSAVWPHLRDVYVLKVEPQLVRIGQRLGRYKEKKSKLVVEETESITPKSTFVKPTSSVLSTAVSSTKKAIPTSSRASEAEQPPKPEVPSDSQSKSNETPKSKQEIRELAAKTVAEDLELWQGKVSQVAEEGASEIEDRVDEISARMIGHHAGRMGRSLVEQLEATTHSELESLKRVILDILENNKGDPQAREEEVAAAVRAAGLSIKNKAQSIRDWRHSYEQETQIAVTKAAEEHFSILEQTRDLALQKIGMKWAWMDGVTYKDWQKYHQLKARFEEWTEDLKNLITTHPGLMAAQAAGTDIEDEGMAIAHEAAAELGRLRQVAAWKATAEDFSDDFDSNTMQLAAEAAEKRTAAAAESARLAAEAVVEEVGAGADTTAESLGEAASNIAPVEDNTTKTVIKNAEDTETATVSSSHGNPLDGLAAEPTNDSAGADEPVVSLSSSGPADGSEQMEETVLESPDLPIHTIEEKSEPTTVKSALFGAAAESVPTREPVLDEDVFSSASSVLSVAQSDVPASITSAAQSAYTAAIAKAADQYARAMSAVSAQVSGEPKPFHEEMFSSVSTGYFSAMAAANSRLNEAMSAASGSLHGTPTTNLLPEMPTIPSVDWERIQSIAQQKFEDSVNWASERYESAVVAIGAAEPTPSTYLEGAEKRAEKLLDQAKHNYYAGVGIAHARYSEFLSAASTAVSALTATPTPTNIQESASSAISVASEAAGSVVSSVGDLAEDAKDSIDVAWNLLVSRASAQVYGAPTPTPWYENLYAAAGDYASQLDNYAGSITEVAASQAAAASSLADEYAASANSAASSQYAAVSSLVSELVVGKEPSYTESVYSRLAHAYTTGLASLSSIGSGASATAVSAASKLTDAASSGLEAGSAGVTSATDKAKEAIEHIIDEL